MRVIIAVLLGLMLWLLWRWKWGPSEFDREPFPSVSLFLCALPLLLTLWLYLGHRATEKRLATVAAELTGKPAEVECETFFQSFMPKFMAAEGYVGYQGNWNKMFLRSYVCRNLMKMLKQPDPQNVFHTLPLMVFTHEAMHIKGYHNEAETECVAMQYAADAGRRFGLSEQMAHDMAKSYWQKQYQQRGANSGGSAGHYWSPECKPGGALDLNLPYPPWSPSY